jgi:transcriptional regulator with XRE-family HTH domain
MIRPMPPNREPTEEAVGERLRRLRVERGMSQRELACPGVSYAYISRIEAGTRTPSVKALRKLAAKLGVSVEFLETGSELAGAEERELRLAEAELALRLGEAAEAERQLGRVLEEASAAGDRVVGARAKLALALLADERGDHAAAVRYFEAACAHERPAAIERVNVFVTIGRAYGALGAVDREIALYRECIDELVRFGADAGQAMTRYQIRLSYALSDAGEFVASEQTLRDALKSETVRSDRYMRIRVLWSLARLAEMEGRSRTALRHARRAIALLEETEDDLQRGRAHILAAWILNSAGDPAEAQQQLAWAEDILGPGAPADDLVLLKVERARAHALLGRGDEAVTRAREAIELIGERHGPILGTAYWALAAGLAQQGDIDAAGDAYTRSLALLEQHSRWREAAAAARAWAHSLREADRTAEAFEALERSSRYADHLRRDATRPAARR